jgi:glycosyltransferase involved in cell wall biosynthesis
MRILVHSRIYPSIGGIETVTQLLAQEWNKAGEEVIVATDVSNASEVPQTFPYPVCYRPGPLKWVTLLRWCDVYLQFNVSLKAMWPLLLMRRPLVISHHGYYWLTRDGKRDWRERLKINISSRSANIFVSSAIAREVKVQGEIIPNPYDEILFRPAEVTSRDTELAFVGRLVSDKGADCLLRALGTLKRKGKTPRLSIIGDGPERRRLEKMCSELNLYGQVRFLGARSQPEVSALLRRHRIVVVPSLWAEPFGMVAIEGLASGCLIIGSEQGGLPEAIGPCGLTFPNGDVNALAEKIEMALADRNIASKLLDGVEPHLAKHRPAFVAGRYLEVMRRALS